MPVVVIFGLLQGKYNHFTYTAQIIISQKHVGFLVLAYYQG